jgi:hypothetical protein
LRAGLSCAGAKIFAAFFVEELARRRRTDPIFTQLCFESPNAASSVNPWTMESPK